MSRGSESRAALLEEAIRRKRAAARSRAAGPARRPPGEPARLGAAQRSLWLLHRMDPASAAYNLASVVEPPRSLDPDRLRSALTAVVARHRILRSSYEPDGETARQRILPPSAVELECLEVGELALREATLREARRPFDLARGPLTRLVLLVNDPGERRLLLVLHHIIADERSLGLLWWQLAEAYEGDSPAATEAEGVAQFDDWVHRERDRMEAAADDLAFWRERLEPPPDELRLPFARSDGERPDRAGGLRSRGLDPATRVAVRRLAGERRVSPFAVYAFVFRALLQRYAPAARFAFGTPVSTRSEAATADMIGYFLNPVVVPTAVDEDLPPPAALDAFAGELRRLLEHRALPFDALVQRLELPRHGDRHPLFQVLFVYQEAISPIRLAGAELVPEILDLGESKFDLTLFVTEAREGPRVAVEYRADRFATEWMDRLLGHYEQLLRGIVDGAAERVADLDLLPPGEEERLRGDEAGPEPPAASGPPLTTRILELGRTSPELPALVCGESTVTYGELRGAASAIARELAARGVGSGDRVAVLVERSPAMIAAVLGTHAVGAAYVPLDPSYPARRNGEVLADALPAAVLTTARLARQVPPDGPAVVLVDTLAPAAEPPAGLPDCDARSAAYVLYTSGSTGHPKGVVVTQQNLRLSTDARSAVYDAAPERFLLLSSLAFDSSAVGVFWTLSTGGTLVVPTDEEAGDPRALAGLIARQGITTLLSVPTLYDQLLRHGAEPLDSLATAIVAGESCPPRLVRRHFETVPAARLYNEYGPTEATVWAAAQELTVGDASGPVPIGRPIPGVRIELRDERGRRVPAGVPGEATIVGPTVALGYWRHADRSVEPFGPSPGTYRTGDRMARTADGRLLFLGRLDEQVKLRGFRIEPAEIEVALEEQSGVSEAVVVARPAASSPEPAPLADGGARLVAFVRSSEEPRPRRWREALARRLPAHMVPHRFAVLPRLPRLPNGKADRDALRALELADAGPDVEAPPASDLESALLSLWRGLLGRRDVGLDDNFFELGGHSLLVVEMAQAIERDHGVALSAAEVFERPTVRQLARRLERRAPGAGARYVHLFPIQPTGSARPLVVAVPHVFTETLAARFRGERPVYGLRGVSLRAEGNLGRWRTMEELAEELVDEIERRFPGEACILGGYSFGASMAAAAVGLMEERGVPVHRLCLVAPMALDFVRLGPLAWQVGGLRKPVEELSTGEALGLLARDLNPASRRPYQRVWRYLSVQPRRRVLCAVGRLRRRRGLPLTPEILDADVRFDRFRLHRAFRPAAMRTPTVIFNPREPATDAAATWRHRFVGPLTVVETPDPHLGAASLERAKEIVLAHIDELESA